MTKTSQKSVGGGGNTRELTRDAQASRVLAAGNALLDAHARQIAGLYDVSCWVNGTVAFMDFTRKGDGDECDFAEVTCAVGGADYRGAVSASCPLPAAAFVRYAERRVAANRAERLGLNVDMGA